MFLAVNSEDACRQILAKVNSRYGSLSNEANEGGIGRGPMDALIPPLDLFATSERSYLILCVPGAKEKDVHLEMLNETTLKICGKIERPHAEREEGNFLHRECRFGAFLREVQVDRGTREEDCKARLQNGVLVVEVPTKAATGYLDFFRPGRKGGNIHVA